jgi:phenylpyruvate tautomerase PptA (4-oxalocrotonate tautomerase family)
MPLIDLHVPAGALPEGVGESLLEELATILLRWEGAPDTPFFREITWTYLHEATLAVGGRPGGAPRYRVEVSVPAGALSQRRKAGVIADMHAAVARAAGIDGDPDAALHVWTLIRDVPEGSWGAGGTPVTYAQLQKLAAAEQAAAAG